MDGATQRRNIILSEPLADSLLHRGGMSTPTLWLDKFAVPSCPLGISRFEAQLPTVPASLTGTSASSSLVATLTNCSVVAGASIVATPLAAGDISFVMDWAKFETRPWIFAAMAAQFKFDWTTTNISAITISAEGWDGTLVTIATVSEKGAWTSWPLTGTAIKFAGSWEQAFGAGYITDTGADVDADGISPATMGDTLRSINFGLLPGRTARRIVWTITPTSSSSTVSVAYPDWRHSSHTFIPEIAQQGVFVSPNGPGIRWGQVMYWNAGANAYADPPIASGASTMPTILDALASRRAWFEGKASTDGLDTEIAAIYESGVEYTTVRKHQAVDPTDAGQSCHSFVVQAKVTPAVDEITQPVFCLVSSLREMPPMAAFPVRDRDDDFQTTDDWCQKVWSCAHRDRYYVSNKQQLSLYDGADLWTAADGNIFVDDWKIHSHSRAVDNSEALFEFRGPQSIVYSELRPWHGSFAIIDQAALASGPLSSDAHPDGRHFRAYLYDGEVVVEKRGQAMVWVQHFTGIMADWCAIRIEKFAKAPILYLVTQEGTSIVEYTSTDSGANFTMSSTLHSTGTPRYPTLDIELDGVRLTYWVNNASAPYIVQYLVRDRAGNTLAVVGTAVSGIDDAAIAVRKATPPGGVPTIYLQAIVGGVVTEYSSTDGKVFV